VIRLSGVGVVYPGSDRMVLQDVDLAIEEGELALVVGATGSGKSTLLGTLNGLVPYATGGTLSGHVVIDGLDTRTHPPRDLAHVVGWVGQDPVGTFVTGSVEEELAYAMEQLAVPPAVMRTRVEHTLDLLGIAGLRHRSLGTLSGGEQQRVAIGAVLTAGPRVLVLDEPTSALDPAAAEEVLGALLRLVHDLGITVVVAEHRVERVVEYADRLVVVGPDGTVCDGDPTTMMRSAPVAPPVVELGRAAGWDPLPLSVRAARRRAPELRSRLASLPPTTGLTTGPTGPAREPVISARGVVVRHGHTVAVRDVDLDIGAGEIVAVMGRNGAGKSSLLWTLAGAGAMTSGRVRVDGLDVVHAGSAERRRAVGLVPQTATDLLYLETVAQECGQADEAAGAAPGTCAQLLRRILGTTDPERHPRDLSAGQQLALVLAVQLTGAPAAVVLDEPTRGLDYTAKRHLVEILRGLAAEGRAVLVATHDVELVAQAADRVVVLADGEVVADGATSAVVTTSPTLAPQVAKVLGAPWLSVDQVTAALGAETAVR
jgi:energy-coupling factor transporter ATP-binding protein EcfA2